MNPIVERATNANEAAERLANWLSQCAREALESHGVFHLVLSGGRSPTALFNLLAQQPELLPWTQTQIFWADERAVEYDHPSSNFGTFARTLLHAIPIATDSIYPMPVTDPNPEAAAEAYENLIRQRLPISDDPAHPPRFDAILLGVGADGHTASLFPGSPHLDEQARLVVPVPDPVGLPPVPRMTMTLPLLNAAHHLAFLASSEGKKTVLERILAGGAAAHPYPAARIQPATPPIWFIYGARP